MHHSTTPIEGLLTIQLDVFGDSRGFFMERFNLDKFKDAGLPGDFVQMNHSRSAPGVLRGLHYQHTPPQGKLVGVTSGRIWDVAVDLRPDSPTVGQHFGVELSGDNGVLFWIPPGFGHGFCVLGDKPADMLYMINGGTYSAAGEGGVKWDDPDLNVAWPLEGITPTISDRDAGLVSFKEYMSNPPHWEKS